MAFDSFVKGFFFFEVQFTVWIVAVVAINGQFQRKNIVLQGINQIITALRRPDDDSFFCHLADPSVGDSENVPQDGR